MNKGKRFPSHPLTKEEARLIIHAAGGRGRNAIRNKAICVAMYRTGVRVNELCSIQTGDIYPLVDGCAIVRINNPKGYRGGAMPREIGLDKRAAQYIFDWLAVRQQGDGPLFTTRTGVGVLSTYIRQLLPRLATLAGVHRRVHPHAFRHTFAKELYEEGVGLVEIMLAMGHTSLTTTQKYLRHIGATEVVSTTSRRSW